MSISRPDFVKETLEAKIRNIQRGIDHYKTRLKEAQGEEVALTEDLSKKEVELKQAKSELRRHRDSQMITMMTPEGEEVYNKQIAEDHARRKVQSQPIRPENERGLAETPTIKEKLEKWVKK